MSNQFSFKELESVALKTTYPIEINGKNIEVGEVIAYFDKIQIANFRQITQSTTANGGFDNRDLIIWQSTREIDFDFTQGIFNQLQYNIMLNAKLIENKGEDNTVIHQRDYMYDDELGRDTYIYLHHNPNKDYPIFIYDEDGNKLHSLKEYSITQIGSKYRIDNLEFDPNKNYIIDYKFNINCGQVMNIGHELIKGYVELEGRTKVQDDKTGEFRTGIIKIPKLKLMSDLSMRLGENVPPIVSTLRAIGVPVGARGREEVMEIIFLDDNID